MIIKRPPRPAQTIAVALHGIEPATFERCAVIRDWLDDHGVDRVTLLVIPARDLHPIGERSPRMIDWLSERRNSGDAIAQHGFQHVRSCGPSPRLGLMPSRGQSAAEFVGLDGDETRRAVHAGWRLLKLAGIEPDGFVAPAYAYTPALRETLSLKFRWWAGLLRVYTAPTQVTPASREPLAPAWSLATAGPLNRVVSPTFVRLGSLLPTRTLRLDLHPADLQQPRHMMALEWVLQRTAARRTAITYQELAGIAPLGDGAGRFQRAPQFH
jgi:predicted deacetylase